MGIKAYKPTTNGRRGMTTLSNSEITSKKPEKSLLKTKKKTGGRNNQGKITVRHIAAVLNKSIDLLILNEIKETLLVE